MRILRHQVVNKVMNYIKLTTWANLEKKINAIII